MALKHRTATALFNTERLKYPTTPLRQATGMVALANFHVPFVAGSNLYSPFCSICNNSSDLHFHPF